MFLKRLTLRGFKSFADKTVLEFEPGITVIVGPNGSGKSNVVDALTWVLGSSSPKSLRGSSMADVIFAGAPGRPGLGRASVEITIDNGDGALPIDYSEVTVSRAMFASGESSYAINGTECRLLDVAELLSDTGLGRENHTIVGQGRLDAVLNARPEERRAFIEEAAGILKHRRRKERSLRKLAQMDAHVERLSDVLRELRRNLRPLQRQAEAAGRHAQLQAELREVRVALAVRELHGLTVVLDAGKRDAEEAGQRLAGLECELANQRAAAEAAQAAVAALRPRLARATQDHFTLANLLERFRGVAARIDERRAGLAAAIDEPEPAQDPSRLRAEAGEKRRAAGDAAGDHERAIRAVAVASSAREDAERRRRAYEQAAAAEARRRAEARERRLRWEGEVAAARSALAQASAEDGRLAGQRSSVSARCDALDGERAAVRADIGRLDAAGSTLADRLAAAEAAFADARETADAAARAERELERRRAGLEARVDALRAASGEPGAGVAAVLAAAADGAVGGVLGRLSDHVAVAAGDAAGIAAALGPLGDAVLVDSTVSARAALEHVRTAGTGRVLLVAQAPPDEAGGVDTPDLTELGARPVAELLEADPAVASALRAALAGTYLVADLDTAAGLAERFPGLAFVTADAEMAGPRGWSAGSGGGLSPVVARAVVARAEADLDAVTAELTRASAAVAATDAALEGSRRRLDAAGAAMRESDSLVTAAAERLAVLDAELRAAREQLAVLARQSDDLATEAAQRRQRLTDLERRGGELPPDEAEPGADVEAERLDDALAAAREAEVQARLHAGAAQQRAAGLLAEAEALERAAEAVQRRAASLRDRRRRRADALAHCDRLAQVAAVAVARTEASMAQAAVSRDQLDAERAERERELGALAAAHRDREAAAATLRDARHASELAAAQLRSKVEAVGLRLREDFALDPDSALRTARAEAAEAATGVLAGGPERDAGLREDEQRLAAKVALLGAVNPLAQQEYAELQARDAFLSDQLADLQASKADLLRVVAAVDERIREVFASAYADVADAFADIFPRLFPGGEGRLVLTEPDDLLGSGVDVEARPPGKRVKRLSLLSGGERSLTALAVLFAIFAARPSPFYVLDEVEAALDDVNLQRLLDVAADFRASSQLLIVSHQKRTMEVADTLYGVTMRSDGVSKVVSQRVADALPAGASR